MKLFLLPLLLFTTACFAGTCEDGQRQSPVDISATTRFHLPALKFDYRAAPLRIADDGHTVRVRFSNGSQLQIGTQRYTLQQFHFHTPGGDRIAGEEFPMAAHLLHKSQSGQLLALVVLFRTGAENPLLSALLPLIPARADGDHRHPDFTVDAGKLLPSSGSYYRYQGSLTAPPCTEGVDWIVMKQPIELSATQLARYRQRFSDNARAVQPLHQRIVQESF
ncbi:MAG: carbonic anhydrase family protein [Undibacterium sp.]|uniref:carbonic anhydrase n=1 Tax=Undibacterium sp. TaxID=1914977 RepID=UPI0027176494|nr:carbonic anhydrase family protein [Undibacterium sp.]MDO8652509.1 carbonic anhydrase family protein [Undibacterium sp.]